MESNKSKGVVRLDELPSGILFQYGETIALKTEYRTGAGAIEAYIVGSGEFFWGGTSSSKEQCAIMVKPISLAHPQQGEGVGQGCEAGCKTYTGGETKHHPDCRNYPNSMSERLDNSTSVSKPVGQAAEGLTKEQIKAITDTAREFCLVGMRGFDHDVQQFTCRCFNGDNCTCYKNYKNALQTLQPKGEPQAAAPSEPVVGQAAEAKAKIIADVADEVLGKDFCREDVKDLADIYDKYFQPSEPAALKKFYCIGDKDNLFQCEEQCEDCKKGAALKEPQGSPEVTPSGCEADAPAVVITDGEIEGTIRQLWEKWQFEGKVFYHEFEFALKEFTSLLTNHKS